MPPVINEKKCSKCGTCVDICSEDVFYGSRKREIPVVSHPEFCMYCNCCVNDCPVEGAISLRIPPNMMLVHK
jgi:NAD-dependent dihydropyrimidine dehydrogenase PreA subunit